MQKQKNLEPRNGVPYFRSIFCISYKFSFVPFLNHLAVKESYGIELVREKHRILLVIRGNEFLQKFYLLNKGASPG